MKLHPDLGSPRRESPIALGAPDQGTACAIQADAPGLYWNRAETGLGKSGEHLSACSVVRRRRDLRPRQTASPFDGLTHESQRRFARNPGHDPPDQHSRRSRRFEPHDVMVARLTMVELYDGNRTGTRAATRRAGSSMRLRTADPSGLRRGSTPFKQSRATRPIKSGRPAGTAKARC